jgi:predicted nucleic-acid-binding protein
MKTYYITRKNFLDWFYNTGADQEQHQMRKDLGYEVVDKLIKDNEFKVTTKDIFEGTDYYAVRLSYCQGCEDMDGELMDLDYEWELKLID